MLSAIATSLRNTVQRLQQTTLNVLELPCTSGGCLNRVLLESVLSRGLPLALEFDEKRLCASVLRFVEACKLEGYTYRYAPSVARPTLYSSVYACLIFSITGSIQSLSYVERRAWADYFDSFQSPHDGLFRDPAITSRFFEKADWWGSRHLVPHIIAAYTALGFLPKHRFSFLNRYIMPGGMKHFLLSRDWTKPFRDTDDFDNAIMNIGCALQYERDFRDDRGAAAALEIMYNTLLHLRNPSTQLWGAGSITDRRHLSRLVQFAYHVYSVLLYDRIIPSNVPALIDAVLQTQNASGGFAPSMPSTACEDMDSVALLCQLAPFTQYRHRDIVSALRRALVWIGANQNADGGFVFRRGHPFMYGDPTLQSGRNESGMFPTWFRLLSIVLIQRFFGGWSVELPRCPGYQY